MYKGWIVATICQKRCGNQTLLIEKNILIKKKIKHCVYIIASWKNFDVQEYDQADRLACTVYEYVSSEIFEIMVMNLNM